MKILCVIYIALNEIENEVFIKREENLDLNKLQRIAIC